MNTKKINVLSFHNLNSRLYFFPVHRYRTELEEAGYIFDFFYDICEEAFDADCVVVNSKFAYDRLGLNVDKRQRFLEKAKKNCGKLLWFDIRDSTTIHDPDILPFVDGYYKAQILKDTSFYLEPFYSNRVFADYYHRYFGIKDSRPQKISLFVRSEENLGKIQVFWNFSLSGFFGIVPRAYHLIQRILPLPYRICVRFVPPGRKRPRDIACRIGSHTQFGRESISYQRLKMSEILSVRFHVDSHPVSRFKYFSELKQAKIAPSPFGWGESSFRDFEVIASGAALVKPVMDHLITWPSLYIKDKTYISHGWDMRDFVEKIERALQDRSYGDISRNAQELFYKHLYSDQGRDAFLDRVKLIFS